MTRAGLVRFTALVTLAASIGSGCGLAREAERLPEGAYLSADGAALARVLARLEGLSGTPLGRHASDLGERLAGCAAVAGHAPTGGLAALPDALACARAEDLAPGVRALRADADLLLLAPVGEGRRAIVTGQLAQDDGLTLDLRLAPRDDGDGALALLLPGDEPAGAPVLAHGDAVLHARVRPRGGIEVARLVPEGSQGDRLFRLRSALFSSAVLAGVWELAIYLPGGNEPLPPMAAALDVQRPALAVEAMEGFLAELASAWPLHRTPISVPAAGGATLSGACLLDLRILPAFAPCYVATPRALVLGWNPASLARALRAAPEGDAESPSRFGLRLDLLAEADQRLRAARGEAVGPPEREYGWERLEVLPAEGDAALRIALHPGPAREPAEGAR